ncbi:MAG: DUF1707 SHOCT-like domain-containing protein [Stackebrandtia sp.]
MTDKDNLRIGDSDRELVSRLLKSAVDEGKLTLAEYDQRLQVVYEAKTVGDLAPATGDLMGRGQSVLAVSDDGELTAGPRPPSRPKRDRSRTPSWVKWMWFGASVPTVLTMVVWMIALLTGVGTAYLWPAWVAGPLGAVCLLVTLMEQLMIRPTLEERDRVREARRAGRA